MTTTTTIPDQEGEWTPEEAVDWMAANTYGENYATDRDKAQEAFEYVQDIHVDWVEKTRNLHRRWKGTYHMLAGNTLERGGPADIHVPEIYKAIETMVPRLEEVLLEQDPFFRIVPRRKKDEPAAEANSAYLEWQFHQADIRGMVQPALRNMLITQCAAWHCYWDNRESMRSEREVEPYFDDQGNLKRKVKITRKNVIDYAGPVAELVDPFDFIIDTKATDPQKATFVGHRAWMTIDEIRRLGKEFGWVNLDKLDEKTGNATLFGTENDYYRWPRDPTSRYGNYLDQTGIHKQDNRPEKQEIIVLYSKWSMDDGKTYKDYRMTIVGGRVCVDLRENPHEGGLRPYAVMRVTKSGHEFYGIGPFDNAVRINQHLDRYHQIFLRAAEVAACPMVFAEEDSDLPDSLYKVRPFSVFKGVGPVRFTSVPDGSLRAAPLVLGTLKNDLEEVVGNYRINMGQDSGGTATEASLSLQEGNRRNRGHIRAFADGLQQLLTIFHELNLQYSTRDVEFPVLGKRASEMRKSHINIGPADLLSNVRFELVGLKASRTYGMRQTGLMAVLNAGMPLIAANPKNADQIYLLHSLIREVLGDEEADRIVTIGTPTEKLVSQDEENEGLVTGTEIEVDPDDDDEAHLRNETFRSLVDRARRKESGMKWHVRKVILEHHGNHVLQSRRKQAREKAEEERAPGPAVPQEVGGAGPGQATPAPGGMSNAMQALADEPNQPPMGQSPGQNPGPADPSKYGRGSRRGRTVNQTEDRM